MPGYSRYYKFTVPGEPQGKARPRFTRMGHAYTPRNTKNYEYDIIMSFRAEHGNIERMQGEVEVYIEAYYGIPKSFSKRKAEAAENHMMRPTKKPDVDNIIKVVCDALNGVAYEDDKQIVEVTCRKWYANEPRIEVYITGE